MPFKKGENGMGRRQKGGKNKQRLIRYSPTEWQNITKHNIYDQEKIIWMLENNLDITEVIDIMDKKYSLNDTLCVY